jgi:glycosyltransferase involved in cell wall biosynthesis
MLVHVVDPAAYTPPYDRALCAALARAGVEVELVTSRFAHGPVPDSEGYSVDERFYGRASAPGRGDRARRALRAIEHLPGMLGYRRAAASADVVHYQWLPLLRADRLLLPPARPRVFTTHWRLPPAGTRVARALARLLARMDAVVVHTEQGAGRLATDFGVPPERLEVIPHGALDYLARQPDERPLPEDLREVEGPVILAFGLVRPYKGTEVLLEAFRGVEGAELWVVGKPLMPMEGLRELAGQASGTVRFVDRFVTDAEIPAFMRRADLVVLPYLNIEQSGVLYTALAFGRPMVLSEVGGFPEVAARGAAHLTPAGDAKALEGALNELLADPAERERMGEAAAEAAGGAYSWDRIGERTVALYQRLLAGDA